jgi:hypothetical protein
VNIENIVNEKDVEVSKVLIENTLKVDILKGENIVLNDRDESINKIKIENLLKGSEEIIQEENKNSKIMSLSDDSTEKEIIDPKFEKYFII